MAVDDASFQFLVENSSDIICRTAANLTFAYISPSAPRVLGWNPDEMVGKVADEFIYSQDVGLLKKSLRSGVNESSVTVRMRKKDGSLAWVEMRHRSAHVARQGEIPEVVIVIRDISERKALEERLSLLELTDTRTGLSTQRGFDEALEREWHRCLRDSSTLSLLLLDFDHFRHFHEFHREGDSCLSQAAGAVISAVRVTDFAALYGDEDIAIILPSTDASGAIKVAEKIQAALHALRSLPESMGVRSGRIQVTIGMATVSARPGATARMPELLRLGAAQSLQRAKLAVALARRRG
jgi:diguanylate cyclase (GGDEF)-like protein/PAS domain S-box-containing protein